MAVVSTTDVQRAKLELDRMKRSLSAWLKFRTLNDAVIAGVAPTTKPMGYARTVVLQNRDTAAEARLAQQLYVLLTESFPDAVIPIPDTTASTDIAVQLARIAINGPSAMRSPQAQGGIPWLWPVLIVGGLLLAVTTAISNAADVAKQKEQVACIEAGACTDYGFWLKAGGVAAIVYVGWKMGVVDEIKRAMRSR
ncbi:MAG: hypothetical protein ABIO35_10895 [Nitrobacter sp.]